MAEAVVFSLASKVLSAMASPAFTMAYEKGVSIWEARSELSKLKVTVETIQAVLLDAEKKQEGSAAVKNWIQRLKAVLYDVEDFFDEVLTEDLLKQQMMDGKNRLSLKSQVRVSCSKLNPIVSKNSIAKKVKVIRGRLAEISNDMDQLGFVKCIPGNQMGSMKSEKYNARCFISEKSVIGRDEDKNVILEMLTSKLSDADISDGPVVIAIDGIGGMGKTTIAHMIYEHEEVKKNFEKRWFACISDTSSEVEVLQKIYQPMCEQGTYNDLSDIQLLEKIENSIKDKKYLLVLDDVWEADRGRWNNRKSRLSCGAKGSKIIVTTRLPSVVKAMGAVATHNLKGLSEEDSWNLFKSLAFDSSYDQTDLRREEIGRELLKRCRGVPLAIRSMGSLLYNKTIHEWEEIESVGLPTVGGEFNVEIMSVLKLSYNHLPSNLKQCFTYCSLFPKDYRYSKMELIIHWGSHGYININEGEFSFMHLLRMGFFQEVLEDKFGQIWSCKMHDVMHDLAMHLGGEEIIMMSGTSLNVSSCTRHVSLMVDEEDEDDDEEEDGLWNIPTSLLDIKSIRSLRLGGVTPNLDQLCSNFKMLRILTLAGLRIKHIPPSIGNLKLVRYLDLSDNEFEELPDSMANLVNLLVLNISSCNLKAWPRNFKKLIKLWLLVSMGNSQLRLMPEGIGEMLSLQYLSDFVVGKGGDFAVLNGLLKQLRDHLLVRFCEEIEVEDGLNWKLPANVSLKSLDIESYPGYSIRGWENSNCTSKLVRLKVEGCRKVKYLPRFSCLPNLKRLEVGGLSEIEFMEEESEYSNATSTSLFFPCLEELKLEDLPKLKGWRGEAAASTSASSALELSNLSNLSVIGCRTLESFPQCPNLEVFNLGLGMSWMNLFSHDYPSLRKLDVVGVRGLEKIHLASPHLQRISINRCDDLTSIELAGITPEPSLRHLEIQGCRQLESVCIEEHAIAALDEMKIQNCSHQLGVKLTETQGERNLPKVEGCKGICQLSEVGSVSGKQLFSWSIREIDIISCRGIENLHIPSPHLRKVSLKECEGLISAEFEAPTSVIIVDCFQLKNLRIAHPSSLEYVSINYSSRYPGVAGVDWDSIPNLSECSSNSEVNLCGVDGVFIQRLFPSPSKTLQLTILRCSELTNALRALELPNLKRLVLYPMPPRKTIPEYLLQRQALGQLEITQASYFG